MLRFRRRLRQVATSLGLIVYATLAASACSRGPLAAVFGPERSDDRIDSVRDDREDREDREEQLARLVERSRESVPASPGRVKPKGNSATTVWRSALSARGLRVVVATDDRSLWLMRDSAVLFRAPVAVGKSEGFTWAGHTYDFTTPVGRRKVLAKGTEPLWVPPDWHYLEIAVQRDLKVVRLTRGKRVTLGDGTFLEVRGDDVGRINQFGNFWPITPGVEMIFDGKIYIPPIGTNQRRIPEILGTRKLEIGDGYLIHGTNEEKSIGDAVSHGCIRMYNQDVERLFGMVPVGTPVYIF